MKSLRLFDRRVGFSLGALSILLGMVAPAVVPMLASASQITSRSIQMSNSTEGATGVTYTLTFTPANTGATDMIIYFCSNSPLIGAACTAPTGMSLSSVSGVVEGPSGTPAIDTGDTGNPTANVIAIKSLTLSSGANTIELDNVTNPTSVNNNGTFYARVETFDSNAHQQAVWSDATGGAAQHGAELASPTGLDDNGSVATAATNQLGVTAAVLETLTFCTYGDPNNANAGTVGTSDASGYLAGLANGNNGPKGDCTNTNSNVGTSIALGQQAATGVLALSTSANSYAAGWTGLSTNASGGALVYMKNNSPCDGLVLNGGSTCGIPAVNNSGGHGLGAAFPSAGTAAYGLSFGGGASHTAFTAPSSGSATGAIDINTNYVGQYAFPNGAGSGNTGTGNQANAAEDNLTNDIDSTYGGFVYGTEGAPATNQDVPFAIAAGISPSTAAGRYANNLSLIAVGTF